MVNGGVLDPILKTKSGPESVFFSSIRTNSKPDDALGKFPVGSDSKHWC